MQKPRATMTNAMMNDVHKDISRWREKKRIMLQSCHTHVNGSECSLGRTFCGLSQRKNKTDLPSRRYYQH